MNWKSVVIMMNKKENLEYVLTDFLDSVRERKEESDQNLKNEADDFEKGRNLAYFEMLEMLETRCKVYGVNLQD